MSSILLCLQPKHLCKLREDAELCNIEAPCTPVTQGNSHKIQYIIYIQSSYIYTCNEYYAATEIRNSQSHEEISSPELKFSLCLRHYVLTQIKYIPYLREFRKYTYNFIFQIVQTVRGKLLESRVLLWLCCTIHEGIII